MIIRLRNIIPLLLIAVCTQNAAAYTGHSDSTELNKNRLHWVLATEATLFAGTMFGLYHLWYKDYPQSRFHFYNDNHEWQLVDKVGHATSSYYISKIGYESMRWSGVSKKKSAVYGGSLGFIYLLTVETLDGFSAEWGASGGDLIANTLGSAAFIGQQLLWEEQRLVFKFSFHQTEFSQYNTDLLGKTYMQNMLKDYNGQTYWLSGNINSFLNSERFPDWLNVAVGYSGEGMTGARNNLLFQGEEPVPQFDRYSQFYLSLDADLTRIKTRSEFLKILFEVIGFIKIPFPALEFNTQNELKFHWFYF